MPCACADKVCDAIEVAGKNVMSTSSVVTTGLVSEKYVSKRLPFCEVTSDIETRLARQYGGNVFLKFYVAY